jgi:SAM-dependent methyltransferase
MKALKVTAGAVAVSALAAMLALNVPTLPPAFANGSPVKAEQNKAEQDKGAFKPTVGQEGKDVVWVPTAQALVDKMLDMAKMTPQDFVVDLGSGDGRTVITAAKRGATALGVEFNPKMVALSRQNAEKEGVAGKATFVEGDIFQTDFSKANVVTMFLLPDLNVRLRPTLLKMKPGTRIVTNSFSMGDWKADRTESVSEDCTSYCTAYLWIVPANAAGTWALPQGELTLEQKYQDVSGALKSGGNSSAVSDGRLDGERIVFRIGDTDYSGTVSGDAIEGVAKTGGKEEKFRAARVK